MKIIKEWYIVEHPWCGLGTNIRILLRREKKNERMILFFSFLSLTGYIDMSGTLFFN